MRTAIRMATVRPRYWVEEQLYKRSVARADVEALRDRYRGLPLVVVGNGPSLNATPLESFAAVPSIGMNKIDLMYPRTAWRPNLVIAANTSVIRQHWSAMVGSGVPFWVPRKARYFVPRSERDLGHWFHLRPSEDFSIDLAEGAGRSATVTYTALQFAYHLGADPVIIVGVDHSFSIAGKKANQYETLEGVDQNHFDPGYFANQTWAVPDLDASERNYAAARAAFEADGRRIVDATVGGKLRIFERIDIAEAVRIATV
jgi:hypothetical protein